MKPVRFICLIEKLCTIWPLHNTGNMFCQFRCKTFVFFFLENTIIIFKYLFPCKILVNPAPFLLIGKCTHKSCHKHKLPNGERWLLDRAKVEAKKNVGRWLGWGPSPILKHWLSLLSSLHEVFFDIRWLYSKREFKMWVFFFFFEILKKC